MIEREGVTKFKLDHEDAPGVSRPIIMTLNHWRGILAEMGLIGADPMRYGGLGFGNLSARLQGHEFLITGSQTGLQRELTASHYSHVITSWPELNTIRSRGPMKPSSEALTHASMYAANWEIRYVFHCHSPDIWANAETLGIPMTPAHLSYGTPEMAAEAAKLVSNWRPGFSGLFAMGGHEDGVVAYARGAEQAGAALVSAFTAARQQAGGSRGMD